MQQSCEGSVLPFPLAVIASIRPQPGKPDGSESAVTHGVLNRAVAEIMLQGACVSALVREGIPGRVTKLVWMHQPGKAGRLADPRQRFAEASRRHRAATLGLQHKPAVRPVTAQLAQGAQLGPTQR